MTKKRLEEIKKKLTGDLSKDVPFLEDIIRNEISNDKERKNFFDFFIDYLSKKDSSETSKVYDSSVELIDRKIKELQAKLPNCKDLNYLKNEFITMNSEIEKCLNLALSYVENKEECEMLYPHTIISDDLAIDVYKINDNIVEIPFDYPDFLVSFADLYSKLKDIESASTYIKKAINLDRFFLESYTNKIKLDLNFLNLMNIKTDIDRINDNFLFVNKEWFKEYTKILIVFFRLEYKDTETGIRLKRLIDSALIKADDDFIYQINEQLKTHEQLKAKLDEYGVSFVMPNELKNAVINLYREYEEENDKNVLDFIRKTFIIHYGVSETDNILKK